MSENRVKQLSKALEFYKNHEILGTLEKVLNQMLEDDPVDVPAYFVFPHIL